MEEIQSELKEIRRILKDVNYQMQELRETIRGAPFPTPLLPMPQPYQHPWWQHQWTGSKPCGDNLRDKIQASGSINLDETRSSISGRSKTT
jgi:hypothetical protein